MEVFDRLQNAYKALKTPTRLVKAESMKFDGVIRAFTVPFETEAEYKYWWLPDTAMVNGRQVITRAARMKASEKNRYLAVEAHNLITQLGRTQILGFIGSPVYIATQTPFCQYFAVGVSLLFSGATSADTVVNNEIARVVPSSVILTGTQADISSFLAAGVGTGTWTNAGLFGNNATSTPVSGTLMTHSAFAYSKLVGNAVTCDYLINLL